VKYNGLELLLAFAAILVLTLGYGAVVALLGSIPAASNFFGHSLGVAGLLLKLFTETAYSLRKRSRSARWGRTSLWLQAHIFTGLVGPYLALLHTAWRFNGLAGVVVLLMAVVVVSGFIGRYIYTAVPRTADGSEVEVSELQRQISQVESELARWTGSRPEAARALQQQMDTLSALPAGSLELVLGRIFLEWGYRRMRARQQKRMDRAQRAQASQSEALLRRQRTLKRQIASLAAARRLLAVWHSVHIPIGMVLFAAAFYHAGAAFYYATLIH